MYSVKLLHNSDESLLKERKFSELIKAEKYFNTMKSFATSNKDAVYREANAELHQDEILYRDIIFCLYDEETLILKYFIGA